MKNKVLVISATFCLLILVAGMFFISGCSFLSMSEPPEPEVTYGEFPFSITYELNGEIKVFEDVVICEYDGIESLGAAGKYRKWKSYLKSGNERITLLRVEESDLSFEITMSAGLPEYYMGDFLQSKEEYERVMTDKRYLGYVQWENGVQTGCSISKEEAWEKYKIKIIDMKYSQPIENSFKE